MGTGLFPSGVSPLTGFILTRHASMTNDHWRDAHSETVECGEKLIGILRNVKFTYTYKSPTNMNYKSVRNAISELIE